MVIKSGEEMANQLHNQQMQLRECKKDLEEICCSEEKVIVCCLVMEKEVGKIRAELQLKSS